MSFFRKPAVWIAALAIIAGCVLAACLLTKDKKPDKEEGPKETQAAAIASPAPSEAPTAAPVKKQRLSSLGTERIREWLTMAGVQGLTEDDDNFMLACVLTFEDDLQRSYPGEDDGSRRQTLFESIRKAVKLYYSTEDDLIRITHSRHAGYVPACRELLEKGGSEEALEFFKDFYGERLFPAEVDGRFCAWDTEYVFVKEYPYTEYMKYEGELAEFPEELRALAMERIDSMLEDMYGAPSGARTPYRCFISGGAVLFATDPQRDVCASVIFVKDENGGWREFGNSNEAYHRTPTGFWRSGDTCIITYADREQYTGWGGSHKTNWISAFISCDGGISWERIELTLPARFEDTQMWPAVYSPVLFGDDGVIPVRGTIYANHWCTDYMAWFVSHDGGASWQYGGELILDSYPLDDDAQSSLGDE